MGEVPLYISGRVLSIDAPPPESRADVTACPRPNKEGIIYKILRMST